MSTTTKIQFQSFDDFTASGGELLRQKHGVIIAFGSEQREQQMKIDISYVSIGCGVICPSENVEAYKMEIVAYYEGKRKEYSKLFLLRDIVLYDLLNHECFYLGEIDDDIYENLAVFGASREFVDLVYNEELVKYAEYKNQ